MGGVRVWKLGMMHRSQVESDDQFRITAFERAYFGPFKINVVSWSHLPQFIDITFDITNSLGDPLSCRNIKLLLFR